MQNNILARTLITGAQGLVGSYLDFGIKTNQKTLDVTNLKQVLEVCQAHKPKAILHLAAIVGGKACELDPVNAHLVNSIGTYHMALGAKKLKAKLIYLSSGVVFDGTKGEPYLEGDTPNPQNVYGRSKYLGELVVKETLKDYLLVRTGRLFGGDVKTGKNLVAQLLRQLKKKEIQAVGNKMSNLTYVKDFVETLKLLMAQDKKGVFHIVSQGSCSPYDIAKEVVKITNSHAKVVKVKEETFDTDVLRGNFEVLGSRKLKPLRPWQDSLAEYIKTEL